MSSRIWYSVLTGVAFALYGLIIGYVLSSPIPIVAWGLIIGLLFGYYANPEM
jgi:F0F1-type ATP synthase assembly protein I